MIFGNDKIGIDFDLKHNQEVELAGGTKLIIIHEIDAGMAGSENERTTGNINRLEVAPQIGTVAIENRKFPWMVGDRVFMHYMAYDTSLDDEPYELDGKKISIVHAPYIFFKINEDGTFEMAENTYLGKRVLEKEVQLTSGIYLNVVERPIASRIKITNIPRKSMPCGVVEVCSEYPATVGSGSHFPAVGSTVVTCDDYQYPVNYLGEEFIKLTSNEIIGELIEA